jgi:hypothetical protein
MCGCQIASRSRFCLKFNFKHAPELLQGGRSICSHNGGTCSWINPILQSQFHACQCGCFLVMTRIQSCFLFSPIRSWCASTSNTAHILPAMVQHLFSLAVTVLLSYCRRIFLCSSRRSASGSCKSMMTAVSIVNSIRERYTVLMTRRRRLPVSVWQDSLLFAS